MPAAIVIPEPDPILVRRARRWSVVLVTAALVLAADQLTKWWAVRTLARRTVHVVWTMQFNLVYNRGSAFSLAGGRGPLIGVLVIVIVAVLLWQGRTVASRTGAVAIGLVLGGALGNLADRALRGDAGFLHGAVVDFIDFQWWPVFNVADMAVVVGGILLVLASSMGTAPKAAGSHG